MNVRSAEFVKGIKGTDEILTDGVPQIAFLGRSNVGKSSVINSLVNSKDLVKTGKKPGKTTELNFFSINNREFYFVDLPGYGFAELSPIAKEKIQKLIYWYLTESGVRPHCVALILDIKAGLTDFDRQTIQLLQGLGQQYVIVANKVDKLNQKEAAAKITEIKLAAQGLVVVPFSAVEGRGREELLDRLTRDFNN